MVLSIYPRLNDASTDEDKDEHARFQRELARVRHLVDQVPKYDENRELDPAADSMPQAKKDEYLKAGNELLVSDIYFNNFLEFLYLEECPQLQSFDGWADAICS